MNNRKNGLKSILISTEVPTDFILRGNTEWLERADHNFVWGPAPTSAGNFSVIADEVNTGRHALLIMYAPDDSVIDLCASVIEKSRVPVIVIDDPKTMAIQKNNESRYTQAGAVYATIEKTLLSALTDLIQQTLKAPQTPGQSRQSQPAVVAAPV